jgi:preprotein translocase subunit SecF
MEIIKSNLAIDFLGKRRLAMGLSAVLILVSLASIVIHGGLRYGIDFAGGTLVQLKFKTAPNIEDIRSSLREIGLADSTIQEFGSKNDILINFQKSEEKLEAVGEKIRKSMGGSINPEDVTLERVEIVGPKVGQDLREKAILSIIYATIGIILYISWRFEIKFALAAILALLHDVTLTVGAFSILDKEFTLVVIASILTIIGYSLNDTIVVFDRIRENTRRKSKETLESLINMSVNQTLSRTLLTSGTTLIVVLGLFFLGGEIIHDFAFALLIGIVVGTYSSVFIASVFLVLWEEKHAASKAK